MNFDSRIVAGATLAVLAHLLIAAPQGAADETAFVRQFLGSATSTEDTEVAALEPQENRLKLDEKAIGEAQTILGRPYPQKNVTYWQRSERRIWVLQGKGKVQYFRAGFVITGGKLEHAEVLEYRENHGRAITGASFLKQFKGVTLNREQQLSRRIEGVTGATISVDAMRNLARLALYFDSLVAEAT